MKVYVNGFECKHLTADVVQRVHNCGVDFTVDGDPAQEPPVEESIGQDDEGNEIFVPVEYGNESIA